MAAALPNDLPTTIDAIYDKINNLGVDAQANEVEEIVKQVNALAKDGFEAHLKELKEALHSLNERFKDRDFHVHLEDLSPIKFIAFKAFNKLDFIPIENRTNRDQLEDLNRTLQRLSMNSSIKDIEAVERRVATMVESKRFDKVERSLNNIRGTLILMKSLINDQKAPKKAKAAAMDANTKSIFEKRAKELEAFDVEKISFPDNVGGMEKSMVQDAFTRVKNMVTGITVNSPIEDIVPHLTNINRLLLDDYYKPLHPALRQMKVALSVMRDLKKEEEKQDPDVNKEMDRVLSDIKTNAVKMLAIYKSERPIHKQLPSLPIDLEKRNKNDVTTLRKWIQEFKLDVNRPADAQGRTLLQLACKAGREDIVKLLLDETNVQDVNATLSPDLLNPLALVLFYHPNRFYLIDMLLEDNAKVDPSSPGMKPFFDYLLGKRVDDNHEIAIDSRKKQDLHDLLDQDLLDQANAELLEHLMLQTRDASLANLVDAESRRSLLEAAYDREDFLTVRTLVFHGADKALIDNAKSHPELRTKLFEDLEAIKRMAISELYPRGTDKIDWIKVGQRCNQMHPGLPDETRIDRIRE